jgi:hypothetical protein
MDIADSIKEFSGVSIQTIGSDSKVEWHQGFQIVQHRKSADLIAPNAFSQDFFGRSSWSVQVLNNSETVRMKVWKRLPKAVRYRIGPIIKKIILHFDFQFNLTFHKKPIRTLYDEYFDLAYSLVLANNTEDYNLVVGTDIPSGIAAIMLTKKDSQQSWYEAHEYQVHQDWLTKHPRFSANIVDLEKELVQKSDYFSVVSEGLRELMTRDYERTESSFVLTNATQPITSEEQLFPAMKEIMQLKKSNKLLLYHGILTDSRGLPDFVSIFEKSKINGWKLILIGYQPGLDLQKVVEISKNTVLMNAVSNNQIKLLIKHIDVIAMPYRVLDLNTKFGFPNKLGDCLAFQIPYIYNEELLEIDRVSNLTNTGVGFSWEECLTEPTKLQNLLIKSTNLDSDWELANKEFGWEHFQRQIGIVVGNQI